MDTFDVPTARETRLVRVPGGNATLDGELVLPRRATGVVLFAHGSGSSRASPRNKYVAKTMQDAGIATLLFDLLTSGEDERYETRFDIGLLTARLLAATDWVSRESSAAGLALGYFGASTGAAAALAAAAALGPRIRAVVSRGGRPDLAGPNPLARVRAATLLIVGGRDPEVLELNRGAFEELHCEKALQIVPGATHLFEEAGTLEHVAVLACSWFRRWLVDESGAQGGRTR
ncbi:MAG TPA: alpha/beta hydrolase [Casimicrobiaceae bacterium]|jgi:dienelactone hydrolase